MTKYDFSCQTIMQILARHKPAGMNKRFSMAVVVESLANTLDEDKQVKQKSCYLTRKLLQVRLHMMSFRMSSLFYINVVT